MSAQKFLVLFEGPQDYARFDHLSPTYKKDILGRVAAFLKQLGRRPEMVDIQRLAQSLCVAVQDVTHLVQQVLTQPQENPGTLAMVPESK